MSNSNDDITRVSANAQENLSLSDAEVLKLLDEAKQQYEEYAQIISVTRIRKEKNIRTPNFSWENPIGLVMTKGSDA